MKTYLVGGAVRDGFLGLPVRERDWVVVGGTREEMLAQGYTQVGQDFPVFLHPETHEEYALARTERKTAPGYHGFAIHASPEVTLEEDLQRRDLTINAMARDTDGTLIDPWGGRADLDAQRLRHISPAFAEDPVRILRVGRFLARFAPLGFTVAPETMDLMREMVEAGEADALVPERVWQEFVRALAEPTPSVFIRMLRDCGALARVMPEIDALFSVPQPPHHHPEIDTGVHTLMVLDQAARLTPDPIVRFAALVHDLGKGATPCDEWPSHRGHEERGVRLVEGLCERLRAPRAFRDPAVLVTRFHLHAHRAAELRPDTTLRLFESLDAFRRPERLEIFLTACEADLRGRTGHEDDPYPQGDRLRRAHAAATAVDIRALAAAGLAGTALGEAIHRARITAIAEARHESVRIER